MMVLRRAAEASNDSGLAVNSLLLAERIGSLQLVLINLSRNFAPQFLVESRIIVVVVNATLDGGRCLLVALNILDALVDRE